MPVQLEQRGPNRPVGRICLGSRGNRRMSDLPYDVLLVVFGFLAVDEVVSLLLRKCGPLSVVEHLFPQMTSFIPNTSRSWQQVGSSREEALFHLRWRQERAADDGLGRQWPTTAEEETARRLKPLSSHDTKKDEGVLLVLEPPRAQSWRDIEGTSLHKATLFLPSLSPPLTPHLSLFRSGPNHLVTIVPKTKQVSLRLFPNALPWTSVRRLTFLSSETLESLKPLESTESLEREEEEERGEGEEGRNCLVFSLDELLGCFPNLQSVAVLPPASCTHIGLGRLWQAVGHEETPRNKKKRRTVGESSAMTSTTSRRKRSVKISIHMPPRSRFSSLLFVNQTSEENQEALDPEKEEEEEEDAVPEKEKEKEEKTFPEKEKENEEEGKWSPEERMERTRIRKRTRIRIEIILPPPFSTKDECTTICEEMDNRQKKRQLPWWFHPRHSNTTVQNSTTSAPPSPLQDSGSVTSSRVQFGNDGEEENMEEYREGEYWEEALGVHAANSTSQPEEEEYREEGPEENDGLFFMTNLTCPWKNILRVKKYRSGAPALQEKSALQHRQKVEAVSPPEPRQTSNSTDQTGQTEQQRKMRRNQVRYLPLRDGEIVGDRDTSLFSDHDETGERHGMLLLDSVFSHRSIDNSPPSEPNPADEEAAMKEVWTFPYKYAAPIGWKLWFRKLCAQPSGTNSSLRQQRYSSLLQGAEHPPLRERLPYSPRDPFRDPSREPLREQSFSPGVEHPSSREQSFSPRGAASSSRLRRVRRSVPSLHRIRIPFSTWIVGACFFHFFGIQSGPSTWPPQLLFVFFWVLLWSLSPPMRSALAMT
jgi:hypothetical protein